MEAYLGLKGLNIYLQVLGIVHELQPTQSEKSHFYNLCILYSSSYNNESGRLALPRTNPI